MFTACKLIKMDSYIEGHQYKPCWVRKEKLTLKWIESFCCIYLSALEKIQLYSALRQGSYVFHVGWTIVLTHILSFVLPFVFNWSANWFEISWVSWQQHLPRRWSFLTLTSSKNAAPTSQLELEKWQQQNLLHAPKGFSSANKQQGSAPLNGEKKYAGRWEREGAVLSWMVWFFEGECYSCLLKTTALFLLFSFSLFPAQSWGNLYMIIPIIFLWPKALFLFISSFL